MTDTQRLEAEILKLRHEIKLRDSRCELRVFIGYDPRQPVGYNVLAHSVATRSSKPVSITRLQLSQLPIKRTGLTEFTYSRFLCPYLSGFEGYSVFLDSDELCLADITSLLSAALLEGIGSEEKDTRVWVVKNIRQYEWASVMVFNNAQCKVLTPEYVDDPANALFDFAWAKRVGELPPAWNHLVGYDEPRQDAKLVHFTQGLPCWPETRDCAYADAWRAEAKASMTTVSFEALMGQSVHAPLVRARTA